MSDEEELYQRTLTVLRVAAPLVSDDDLKAACYLTGIAYEMVVELKRAA